MKTSKKNFSKVLAYSSKKLINKNKSFMCALLTTSALMTSSSYASSLNFNTPENVIQKIVFFASNIVVNIEGHMFITKQSSSEFTQPVAIVSGSLGIADSQGLGNGILHLNDNTVFYINSRESNNPPSPLNILLQNTIALKQKTAATENSYIDNKGHALTLSGLMNTVVEAGVISNADTRYNLIFKGQGKTTFKSTDLEFPRNITGQITVSEGTLAFADTLSPILLTLVVKSNAMAQLINNTGLNSDTPVILEKDSVFETCLNTISQKFSAIDSATLRIKTPLTTLFSVLPENENALILEGGDDDNTMIVDIPRVKENPESENLKSGWGMKGPLEVRNLKLEVKSEICSADKVTVSGEVGSLTLSTVTPFTRLLENEVPLKSVTLSLAGHDLILNYPGLYLNTPIESIEKELRIQVLQDATLEKDASIVCGSFGESLHPLTIDAPTDRKILTCNASINASSLNLINNIIVQIIAPQASLQNGMPIYLSNNAAVIDDSTSSTVWSDNPLIISPDANVQLLTRSHGLTLDKGIQNSENMTADSTAYVKLRKYPDNTDKQKALMTLSSNTTSNYDKTLYLDQVSLVLESGATLAAKEIHIQGAQDTGAELIYNDENALTNVNSAQIILYNKSNISPNVSNLIYPIQLNVLDSELNNQSGVLVTKDISVKNNISDSLTSNGLMTFLWVGKTEKEEDAMPVISLQIPLTYKGPTGIKNAVFDISTKLDSKSYTLDKGNLRVNELAEFAEDASFFLKQKGYLFLNKSTILENINILDDSHLITIEKDIEYKGTFITKDNSQNAYDINFKAIESETSYTLTLTKSQTASKNINIFGPLNVISEGSLEATKLVYSNTQGTLTFKDTSNPASITEGIQFDKGGEVIVDSGAIITPLSFNTQIIAAPSQTLTIRSLNSSSVTSFLKTIKVDKLEDILSGVITYGSKDDKGQIKLTAESEAEIINIFVDTVVENTLSAQTVYIQNTLRPKALSSLANVQKVHFYDQGILSIETQDVEYTLSNIIETGDVASTGYVNFLNNKTSTVANVVGEGHMIYSTTNSNYVIFESQEATGPIGIQGAGIFYVKGSLATSNIALQESTAELYIDTEASLTSSEAFIEALSSGTITIDKDVFDHNIKAANSLTLISKQNLNYNGVITATNGKLNLSGYEMTLSKLVTASVLEVSKDTIGILTAAHNLIADVKILEGGTLGLAHNEALPAETIIQVEDNSVLLLKSSVFSNQLEAEGKLTIEASQISNAEIAVDIKAFDSSEAITFKSTSFDGTTPIITLKNAQTFTNSIEVSKDSRLAISSSIAASIIELQQGSEIIFEETNTVSSATSILPKAENVKVTIHKDSLDVALDLQEMPLILASSHDVTLNSVIKGTHKLWLQNSNESPLEKRIKYILTQDLIEKKDTIYCMPGVDIVFNAEIKDTPIYQSGDINITLPVKGDDMIRTVPLIVDIPQG